MARPHRHGLVGIAAVLLPVCCVSKDAPPRPTNTRWTMIEARQAATRLSGYAWNNSDFADENNRGEILRLMDELIGRFHQVDKISSRYAVDPSFSIILENERGTLQDIRDHYAANRTELAVVIMEFPKTPEAAQAFRMYEDFQLMLHVPDENGQIALSENGKKRLEHLRHLAAQ